MPELTIGDIVHYKTPNGIAPAIVTFVGDSDNPNVPDGTGLYIFDPFGGSYGIMGVEEGDEQGQWHWP
jgi:hypothetical protein